MYGIWNILQIVFKGPSVLLTTHQASSSFEVLSCRLPNALRNKDDMDSSNCRGQSCLTSNCLGVHIENSIFRGKILALINVHLTYSLIWKCKGFSKRNEIIRLKEVFELLRFECTPSKCINNYHVFLHCFFEN